MLEVVPEGTRTEVVEHRLPEEERICSACGSELVEIGKEVRRTLQMKPAEFWVCEDVYYTYACKNCEQETGEANIVKAAKEPALLPGSFASAEAFLKGFSGWLHADGYQGYLYFDVLPWLNLFLRFCDDWR